MILASSHLATTTPPNMSFALIQSMAWPALLAAIAVTVLTLALLSYESLSDTELSFKQRLRHSPLSNIFIWAIAVLGLGLSTFMIVFCAQLVMLYTDLNLIEAIGAVIGSVVGVAALCALTWAGIDRLREHTRKGSEHSR